MSIGVTNIGSASGTTSSPIVLAVPGGVPAGSVIVLVVYDPANLGGSGHGTATDSTGTNTYFQNVAPSYTTGVNPNGAATNGTLTTGYTFASNVIPPNGTITYTPLGSGGAVFSAYYATNAVKTNINTVRLAFGAAATAPTITLNNVPEAGSLVVATLCTVGPGTDSFAQDSTNAPYGTTPVRASLSTIATIAGGSVITSSQVTYAPTISPGRPWALIIHSLQPGAGANLSIGIISASATGAVGALNGQSFLGVSATGAVASLATKTEVDAVAIGVAATGAVTTPLIQRNNSVTISGVAAVGAVADLLTLAGVAATGAVTAPTPTIEVASIGVSAIGVAGAVTTFIDPAVFITGVSATGVAGYIRFPVTHAGGDDKVWPDQRSRYLAWREQQWRKRRAQKDELVAPPLPPAPLPIPAVVAPIKLDPVIVPDHMVDQWQQQHPLVPVAQLAPFTAPPPSAPPLPQLSNQLELLRRQMKIKV